jgi:hypothetical protein
MIWIHTITACCLSHSALGSYLPDLKVPIMIEGVTDSWTASARETLTIDGMVKQIGQQDVKVRTASHWAESGDGYNLHESLEHYVQYNVKRRPKLSKDMTEHVYVSGLLFQTSSFPRCSLTLACSLPCLTKIDVRPQRTLGQEPRDHEGGQAAPRNDQTHHEIFRDILPVSL